MNAEEFEKELQNCLLHLYDYAYLQDNPVVKAVVPETSTSHRVQQFRERIMNGVNSLRPPDNAPDSAKGSRAYDVLSLRYIEQADIDEITDQLAISRRQFYRELSRGVTYLANMLCDKTSDTPEPIQDVFTLQSEIASLHQYSNRSVVSDLNDLLHGAIKANKILAANHGVTIQFLPLDKKVSVSPGRGLLRQLVVVLISAIVSQYDAEGTLNIDFWLDEDAIHITFGIDRKESVAAMCGVLRKQPTIAALLEGVSAQLILQPEHFNSILLSIPRRNSTILIIDDNPDVINLFQRLLDSSIYRIVIAPDGLELFERIGQLSVNLIILDIMLPHMDGFEVLQALKNDPRTHSIPVVICSVLKTEELVLTLGADAVIPKPPAKADLDQILSQWA